MNTPAMRRVDDAMKRMLSIHDARQGRSLTKSQADDFHQAQRDALDAFVEAGRGVMDSAEGRMLAAIIETDDVDHAEQLTRQYQRMQARNRIVAGTPTFAEEFGYGRSRYEQPGRVREAIEAFVRTAQPQAIEFTGKAFETRALQSAGGSAVPTSFYDSLVMYMRTGTPMMDANIVRVVETIDGAPIVVSRLTADPNHGGTVTAEAAGINELDATVSGVTLSSYKYGITQLYSYELAQDNAIDLERNLAKSAARELSIDIGGHLTTGDGSGKPTGIITAAVAAGATATGTATGTSADTYFSPADLMDLWYTLPAPYRAAPGAGFMVSSSAMSKIAKFKDTTGQWLYGYDENVPQGVSFRGIPVYENPAMAAVGSATKSVIAGDFSTYYTRVVPVRVEISRDYKFNTDQIALRTIFRVDGNLPDIAGVRALTNANT